MRNAFKLTSRSILRIMRWSVWRSVRRSLRVALQSSPRWRYLKRLVVVGLCAVVIPCNLVLLTHLHQHDVPSRTSVRPYQNEAYMARYTIPVHGNKSASVPEVSTYPRDGSVRFNATIVPYIDTPSRFRFSSAIQLLKYIFLGEDNTTEEYLARISRFWPDTGSLHDRITEQLMFTPRPKYNASEIDFKTIVSYSFRISKQNMGQMQFLQDGCPVNTCMILPSWDASNPANAVLISSSHVGVKFDPQTLQIWHTLESPFHSDPCPFVNWTATYRRDSTIVTPYEKFIFFPNAKSSPPKASTETNYSLNKTRMVAMFVSNCNDKNGRLNYAKELSHYIQVDIYGACGKDVCPRHKATQCYEMLRKEYRFYLSFENSNCRDYITEKLYWNAYKNDVIPVVMGAAPEEYAAVAPPRSYIHVDDFDSPLQLARYLYYLSNNAGLYNSYFQWKQTGEFINTKFWCRLCAMLHAKDVSGYTHYYADTRRWWSGEGTRPGMAACLQRTTEDWVSWRHPPYNYTRPALSTVLKEYGQLEQVKTQPIATS